MRSFRIIVLIFGCLFLCTSLYSQTKNEKVLNFVNANQDLIWQKVYDSELTTDQIINLMKQNIQFFGIDVLNDSTIVSSFKIKEVDYIGAGYKRGTTPMYLLLNSFLGKAIIQIKSNRYRVTLKDLMSETSVASPLGGTGQQETLSSGVIKRNGKFRDVFKESYSKILDFTFSKLFDFNGHKEFIDNHLDDDF